MGKAARAVCIFLPMVLTIAALVFQIMVGLGGTNSRNTYLSNIYFLQANTTGIAHNSSLTHTPANNNTPSAAITPNGNIKIENIYTISLWNYCASDGTLTKKPALQIGNQTVHTVDFCTKRKLHFWFNPVEVWGLNRTSDATVDLGPEFRKVLRSYAVKNSRWIPTLYILTVVATCVEILIGIGGIYSRLGSLFTTLSSLVTTIFSFAFAVLATSTYAGLGVAGNTAFKLYGIRFHFGSTMYIYIWLAVACSLVSLILWAFSACCCSGRGRSQNHEIKTTTVERTPYTYERVDGPYGQQSTVQLNTVGGRPGAYEPFRHGN